MMAQGEKDKQCVSFYIFRYTINFLFVRSTSSSALDLDVSEYTFTGGTDS